MTVLELLEPELKAQVLNQAILPEHVIPLMSAISSAEPFLVADYLGFARQNWLIFVGYPLKGEFSASECNACLEQSRAHFKPEYLWFIGPQIPLDPNIPCRERQSDQYLVLDLVGWQPRPALMREVGRVAHNLSLSLSRECTQEHLALAKEFMQSHKLPALVTEMTRSLPDILQRSPQSYLLEGRDRRGRLNAFFLLERAAPHFDIYVLGCYSRQRYIPHASDLLFYQMVRMAMQSGKDRLHLGLGVNPGIRRFKEKWGGKIFLPYESCECGLRVNSPLKNHLSILDAWLDR